MFQSTHDGGSYPSSLGVWSPCLLLSILLPQYQVNAMVGHACGKHQSRVIAPVQAVEPGRHTGQEAGSSFGFSVGWQRPAARNGLCPQVHHIQELVVEKECKHLAKAEQGQVGWVLRFYHPGNIKTCWIKIFPYLNKLLLSFSVITKDVELLRFMFYMYSTVQKFQTLQMFRFLLIMQYYQGGI